MLASWIVTTPVLYAQDLVPAAYTPGPVGLNVVTLIANFNKGDITFDPSLPIEDGHATISVAAVGYIRSFSLFGRYAHAGIIVPFVHGHVQGVLFDEFQERTRTGVGDLGVRLAANLYGARAMTLKEFAAYRWSTIVGFGLVVGVPVGEYDDTKVINIGTHRWSFKPEIGVSRRRGHWTFEGDVGMVAFTDNTNFLNGGRREQAHDRDVSGPRDLLVQAEFLDRGRRQLLARRPPHHQRHAGPRRAAELARRRDHRHSRRAAAAPRRRQRRRAHAARRRFLVVGCVVQLRVDAA